ncbi:MAG: tetratricopeptide repeat protein, partial [Elusimicrobia bacterium]|nr:tetratricopeptide repeat protein [Elusimicrobiota bacterium]
IKYYIAAFPALAIIVAWTIDQYEKEKFVYTILLLFFLFLNFCNFLYMLRISQAIYRPLGIITGSIEREEFLSKSHAAYPHPAYSGYKFINENLPHTAKVLIFGEARCYYIKRNFISWAVQNLNPLFEILKNSNSPQEIYENMRKQKITHILVNVPEAYRIVDFYISAREWKILENFWKKHLKLIFAKNNNFVYELVEQTERPSQNIIKFIYQRKKTDIAKEQMKKANFKAAIKHLDELVKNEVADDLTHYYLGVCYANLNEKEKAKLHIRKAIKLNPGRNEYKKLLNQLK